MFRFPALPIRLSWPGRVPDRAVAVAVLALLIMTAACETMNPRNETPGNPGLANEAENWKVKRITPENLLLAARWAGDSLTRTAMRELDDNSLPLDSFRIKRLPATAALAASLGATVAIVPVARPATDVRVSRPTNETFAYVRPADQGRVWRAYFTRRGIAELFTQRTRAKTRAEKRGGQSMADSKR